MSYGRSPYYIWSNGVNVHFNGQGIDTFLPVEALAQFVASMCARGDEEVKYWIELGKSMRPEDIHEEFRVTTHWAWGSEELQHTLRLDPAE